MTNVTGTNFILATDLSGALTFSQIPTNTALLPVGTNVVVIAVKDSSANAAYSTNTIVVRDETPPLFLLVPQSRTNIVGTTANFSAGATACTPLVYQWLFNKAPLSGQTNSALAIVPVSPASAGNYSVVATASGGSTTSVVATLTVDLIPASLALNSSDNPAGFKDSLNFTAAMTPAGASGGVQFFTNGFYFDGETLVAGQRRECFPRRPAARHKPKSPRFIPATPMICPPPTRWCKSSPIIRRLPRIMPPIASPACRWSFP